MNFNLSSIIIVSIIIIIVFLYIYIDQSQTILSNFVEKFATSPGVFDQLSANNSYYYAYPGYLGSYQPWFYNVNPYYYKYNNYKRYYPYTYQGDANRMTYPTYYY